MSACELVAEMRKVTLQATPVNHNVVCAHRDMV